jgi:hypothetical protein
MSIEYYECLRTYRVILLPGITVSEFNASLSDFGHQSAFRFRRMCQVSSCCGLA